MNALLAMLQTQVRPWRERADELARRYNDVFPASRMCAFYISRCYPEFVDDVTRQAFGCYMAVSLRRLSAE